jgi:hypothetical protein
MTLTTTKRSGLQKSQLKFTPHRFYSIDREGVCLSASSVITVWNLFNEIDGEHGEY